MFLLLGLRDTKDATALVNLQLQHYSGCVAVYRDKILLLNKTTEVINYWQDEASKHSLADAKAKFPDCRFQGA